VHLFLLFLRLRLIVCVAHVLIIPVYIPELVYAVSLVYVHFLFFVGVLVYAPFLASGALVSGRADREARAAGVLLASAALEVGSCCSRLHVRASLAICARESRGGTAPACLLPPVFFSSSSCFFSLFLFLLLLLLLLLLLFTDPLLVAILPSPRY
jgi:hypothetical protein